MHQTQLATLGIWELLVILAIVMLIFGAGKLPQLGDSLGKGIRNFRKSFRDDPKEVEGEAKRVSEPDAAAQLPYAEPSEMDKDKKPAESHVDKS